MKIISIFLLFSFFYNTSTASDFPEMSIFHLNSEWISDSGNKTSLKSMSNKVTVIAMAYTSCKHTCPMIISKMQDIERSLKKELRGKIHFAILSFDSKRDTPEVLKKYKEKSPCLSSL